MEACGEHSRQGRRLILYSLFCSAADFGRFLSIISDNNFEFVAQYMSISRAWACLDNLVSFCASWR